MTLSRPMKSSAGERVTPWSQTRWKHNVEYYKTSECLCMALYLIPRPLFQNPWFIWKAVQSCSNYFFHKLRAVLEQGAVWAQKKTCLFVVNRSWGCEKRIRWLCLVVSVSSLAAVQATVWREVISINHAIGRINCPLNKYVFSFVDTRRPLPGETWLDDLTHLSNVWQQGAVFGHRGHFAANALSTKKNKRCSRSWPEHK